MNMNLYDVNMKDLMADLVEEIQSEHPELTKKDAKLLIMNSLYANLVREELSNEINFLIENNGWN